MDSPTTRLEVQILGKTIECRDRDVIGRMGTVAPDLFAPLLEFAPQHIIIEREQQAWSFYIPEYVKEPVLLDGEPAAAGPRHPLLHSHHVRVGNTTLHFSVVDEEKVKPAQPPEENVENMEESVSPEMAAAALNAQFFELLVNNVHDLIAVVNRRGRRLWNNPAYATMLGYTPEELKGTDSTVEIHPDDQPLVRKTLEDTIRTGQGRRIEYRMRHREGRWLFLESDGMVVPNWPGAGTVLIVIARDVTARKRSEYEMRKRNRRQRQQAAVVAKITGSPEFLAGNLDACLAMITEALVETLNCDRGAIWLINEESGRLLCADLCTNGQMTHDSGEDSLPLSMVPHYLQSLRAVRALIAAQALHHPGLRELAVHYLPANRIVTKLDVPIRRGNGLLGVVTCEGTHQHEWTIDEQNFVSSLADLFLAVYETQERIRTYQALQESQQKLASETAEAARYVLSLLPARLTGEITTDWLFVPSEQLGGDAFGYHWMDADHFAIYLLDVVGHGVGAALLSVTALNVFRNQGLPEVDFHDPAAVLSALNQSFEMNEQNEMYFTAWYGVFHRPSRTLRYSAAGHPPAILFTGDSPASTSMKELRAPGLMIGAVAESRYTTESTTLGAFGRLYVFSDGAYEVSKRDGSAMSFDEFTAVLTKPPTSETGELCAIVDQMRQIQGAQMLPDDCSLLKLIFS